MNVPLVHHSAMSVQCIEQCVRVCVCVCSLYVFVCVRCVSKMERLANNLGQSGHISLTYLLGAGSLLNDITIMCIRSILSISFYIFCF